MKANALGQLIFPLLAAASLHAGTPVAPATYSAQTTGDGWWFRAAPYGWVTAIDGDVGFGNLTVPVDISLSDTLDSLDIAAMGLIEAGYGRWSLGVDFVYGRNSKVIDAGGILFDSFHFEMEQWIITPTVAYRAIETDRYRMDVFAGARVMGLEADVTAQFVGGGQDVRGVSTSWADPIVGVRGQADFAERWFFRYNADIGGFGVGSDLMWQAFGGIGYRVRDGMAVAVGYRGIGVDYSEGNFFLDTVSHGPVIGVEIRF